jgi:pectate lyase C
VDNGGGYYKILNKYSGKALEVKGFSTANGSNTIDQWTWSGGDNQQWSLVYLY